VDDSQDQTGAKGLEALKDSALARRIVRRYTGTLGVIDMHHTLDHYSRLTEWPAQRHGLLDQLKDRYDLSGAETTGGNMVYTTHQRQRQDADESFEEARPSTFAGESFETPKTSAPAASAAQGKFRVSRKPNPAAGKSLKHDAPDASSQATATDGRDDANHSRQTEMKSTTRPAQESLASTSEIVTDVKDSTPSVQPTVLRLSRKRAGQLVQKTSGPGMDERGSTTMTAPATVHQLAWANETETPQFPASMPVVSEGGPDDTSDSPVTARVAVRRAAGETVSEAPPVLSSKQSALDQQSSAKETAPLLLRKSRTDKPAPTPQTPESESVGRASSADGSVKTSSKERSVEKVRGESVRVESAAGEALERPVVGTEMRSVAREGQIPETLPLVKAQPVAAQVQLKRADEATENVGPVSRADADANRSSTALASTALAVEMRPAASRAQASGIVWRKSTGESSPQNGTGSSGRSGYSSASSTSSNASTSLPLTSSAQAQGHAPAQVQRQTDGEGNNVQTGSPNVVQRVEQGAGPEPSQAHAPEVDLERITEHVSRAIFRQLAIERERRGF
jgi:hypothetical protein